NPKVLYYGIIISIFSAGSEQLQVHQNPEVTFNLGENVHLPCRFTARNVVQIGSYKWYKDHVGGTEVSNGIHGKAILKTNIETFIKDKNASITILQPSHNDSGYYYCEVDLLGIGTKATGNGTRLVVKMPENKPNSGELECSKYFRDMCHNTAVLT
uniref:Natural cytotoxicity triggering receptor 3 n=1 Tax=Erpetoichthys calabaricus TaxID=27687 RepID=A0A8C4X557_ERPCA